jgi:hypothetical protein
MRETVTSTEFIQIVLGDSRILQFVVSDLSCANFLTVRVNWNISYVFRFPEAYHISTLSISYQ